MFFASTSFELHHRTHNERSIAERLRKLDRDDEPRYSRACGTLFKARERLEEARAAHAAEVEPLRRVEALFIAIGEALLADLRDEPRRREEQARMQRELWAQQAQDGFARRTLEALCEVVTTALEKTEQGLRIEQQIAAPVRRELVLQLANGSSQAAARDAALLKARGERKAAPKGLRAAIIAALETGLPQEAAKEVAEKKARRKARTATRPEKSLQERFRLRCRRALLEALRGYRLGAESTEHIEFGEPAVTSAQNKVWKKYGSKSWLSNVFEHSFVVPRSYFRTVVRPGLTLIDGMATLALEPTKAPGEGWSAWKAAWVEQGAGCSLRLVRGFVLRSPGGDFAHGETVRGAMASLRARSGACDSLKGLAPYSSVVVTFQHSRAAGNCATGTRDWIAKHMPGRDSATVGEILRVARATMDRPEYAARACWAAIRATEVAA